MNSFPSANQETETKNNFYAVEDFTSFWWHSGTQKWVGKRTDQIDAEDISWGSIVRSLNSLTFMQLIPSADRVVLHICIWCVWFEVQCTNQTFTGYIRYKICNLTRKTNIKIFIRRIRFYYQPKHRWQITLRRTQQATPII